jgi:hypothetical protein
MCLRERGYGGILLDTIEAVWMNEKKIFLEYVLSIGFYWKPVCNEPLTPDIKKALGNWLQVGVGSFLGYTP